MATSQPGLRSLQLNMKAGMEGLDSKKVNQIIQQISAGSSYYLHQQKRQGHIDQKVLQLKKIAENITPEEIATATAKMDKLAAELESERQLNRIIVHVDMDAFFAAVEMRNNPELKDKPMAVGSQSMLGTSNYLARRFGVRAAMPGFIAMKLCPELIIVPSHFDEYHRVSKQVQEVFRIYDPDFSAGSLDEGYLDITNYVESHKTDADDMIEMAAKVVNEMREDIFKATDLTASAGIAPNMMLAKICSDQNKPNGQFQLKPCKKEILDFMKNLPVRKVNGIGNVTEQLLNSQGVITCSDMWEKRGLLSLLFSSANWFLRIAMGIGSVHVKNDDYSRKSMSVERTFNDTNNAEMLHQLCQEMSEELSTDLQAEKLMGRTVTLKLKMSDFTLKTKASTLMHPTSEAKQIASVAHNLLSNEIKASNEKLKLRLMGVRMSSLGNECDFKQQCTIDSLFSKRNTISGLAEDNLCNRTLITSGEKMKVMGNGIPEDITSMENPLNQQSFSNNETELESTSLSSAELNENTSKSSFLCPVCETEQTCSLEDFNKHLDVCLNRKTIKQILNPDVKRDKTPLTTANKKRKRNALVGTIEKFINKS